MEGTAVVDDVVTADLPEITPSEDAGTVQEESPETGDIDTTPDSDTDATEPRTLSLEEHEKALKDLEARLTESARRKEENARAEAEAKARAQQFDQRSQAARQDRAQFGANYVWQMMNEAKKAGENGEELKWDANKHAAVVARLENMAFQQLYEQFTESADSFLETKYPDFAIPRELASKLDRATKAYSHGDMFDARMEILEQALLSDLTPKLRKQVEEELAKSREEEAKEGAMRGADTNKGQRPTGSRGNPPAGGADLSSIIGDPTKSDAEKRAAYEKKYGFKPNF